MVALASWYKRPPMSYYRKWFTYRRKVAVIKLKMHRKILFVTIAGKLFRLAYKLSPEFVKTYDKMIVETFLDKEENAWV